MANVPITIKVGERIIPFRFRMNQYIEAEEALGNMAEVEEKIKAGNHRGETLVTMIRIMGNAGLQAEGYEPDLTDEWLKEEMLPGYINAYAVAVLAALGWETRIESKDNGEESEERDLVLEEINKKKDEENSPGDGSSAEG